MATTIDAVAAMRELLVQQADLTALTSTRIYGPDGIPAGVSMPQQALVIVPTGASPLPVGSVEYEVSFSMHCYGATTVEASQTYTVLSDVLHGKKRQDIDPGVGVGSGSAYDHRLLVARQTGGPRAVHEPMTNWPRVVADFTCIFVRGILTTY